MYNVIGKQLNLDERQIRQLKLELEEVSWLYSDHFWKRALAIYMYTIVGYLLFAIPVLTIFLLLSI